MKPWAMVLSGGGAAASEQFGFIKGLQAAELTPTAIYGTSAGALNAFSYSFAGISMTETFWRSLKSIDDIFESNWWIVDPWRSGLRYPDPLRKRLVSLKGQGQPLIPFTVTVTELVQRKVYYVPHTDSDILEMTISSARIPGLVESYEKNGLVFCDGGVKVNLPLKKAISDGFKICVCLHCTPQDITRGDTWKLGNPLDEALRAYDVSADDAYLAERDISNFPDVTVLDGWAEDNSIGTMDIKPEIINMGINRGLKNSQNLIPKLLTAITNG